MPRLSMKAGRASLHCPVRTQPYSSPDPNATRDKMSGVLEFAYGRAVHQFKEFHDELGCPPSTHTSSGSVAKIR
jgi:hypothetical protein